MSLSNPFVIGAPISIGNILAPRLITDTVAYKILRIIRGPVLTNCKNLSVTPVAFVSSVDSDSF